MQRQKRPFLFSKTSLSLLFVVVVKGRKSVVGRTLNNAAGDEEGRERERERLRRSKLTWERRMRRKVRPEGQTCQEASGDRSIPLFNMQGGSALDTTGHRTFKRKGQERSLDFFIVSSSQNLQGWQTMSLVGPPPPFFRGDPVYHACPTWEGAIQRAAAALSLAARPKKGEGARRRGQRRGGLSSRRRHSLPLPPFLSRKDVLSPPAAARRGSSLRGITNRPSATHGSGMVLQEGPPPRA